MQLPLVEPAPIVMEHTLVFRDLFENRKQFRHFQNYLTGLLVLDNKSVGRLHARIRWRDGRYWLYDEGSASGTTLNFERLGLAPHPLQDGDQIQMGRLRLRFWLGVEFEEEE